MSARRGGMMQKETIIGLLCAAVANIQMAVEMLQASDEPEGADTEEQADCPHPKDRHQALNGGGWICGVCAHIEGR